MLLIVLLLPLFLQASAQKVWLAQRELFLGDKHAALQLAAAMPGLPVTSLL
jgi:hypothetical protein